MAKQVVVTELEETSDPGFDEFFAEAVEGKEPTEEKPVEEKPVEEKPVEEKPVEEKPVEEKPVEEKPVEEKPVEKEDPRIGKLEQEIADLKAASTARAKEEEKKGPSEKEILASQEDEQHLAAFAKDWPDQAKAMEIMQKSILRNVEQVIGDVLKPLFEKIPGLEQAISNVESEKAVSIVTQAHSDWKQLVPEVELWIPTLPKYLQKAANDTLDKGSPEDMIELLNDFKEATGRKKIEEKVEKKEEVNKNRLQAMTAVKTARSTINKSVDPSDFDGAFEEFVK